MGDTSKGKNVNVKKFESINVVPFIDIMLVLLVIVLTTATFVAKGIIPIELPTASNSIKQDDTKIVTITIRQNGELYFNNEKINMDEFDRYITKFEAKTPVNINCDKDVKFDFFVILVDKLKEKNFNNIGIVTKKI